MRNNKLTLSLVLLCILSLSINAQSVFGNWKTIDDDGKTEKSLFNIYESENGTVEGKVIKILDPTSSKICTECSGKRKDQPIEGMILLQNLEKNDDVYENGTIIDPKSGKEYSCYIELQDENTLKVRGYLGFSLLGRTQIWYRAE